MFWNAQWFNLMTKSIYIPSVLSIVTKYIYILNVYFSKYEYIHIHTYNIHTHTYAFINARKSVYTYTYIVSWICIICVSGIVRLSMRIRMLPNFSRASTMGRPTHKYVYINIYHIIYIYMPFIRYVVYDNKFRPYNCIM